MASCVPASGSSLALGGRHRVTCTATDASGHSSSGSFDVTVVPHTVFLPVLVKCGGAWRLLNLQAHQAPSPSISTKT
jgi:hypothetical protein